MKIKTSTESAENFEKPRIEEGMYKAKLKEVKEISEGQYGNRVAFIYEVMTGTDKNIDLAHICYVPENATPENKFGKILIAHGIDLGSEVETDNLVGTFVTVLVEDYKPEEGKVASTISKVKKLVN